MISRGLLGWEEKTFQPRKYRVINAGIYMQTAIRALLCPPLKKKRIIKKAMVYTLDNVKGVNILILRESSSFFLS